MLSVGSFLALGLMEASGLITYYIPNVLSDNQKDVYLDVQMGNELLFKRTKDSPS